MAQDMLDRLMIDPGVRTLGELAQERQWAAQEIIDLRRKIGRLTRSNAVVVNRNMSAKTPADGELDAQLASRRLLRLADVIKLVGLSRSMVYKLIGEGRFPDRTRIGHRAVRWRAADIFAWQNRAAD